MAKTRAVSHNQKKFNEIFNSLAYKHDQAKLFEDVLTIGLTQFSFPNCEISKELHQNAIRSYSPKEKKIINQLIFEIVHIYKIELSHENIRWHDFFGTYYEIITSRFKSSRLGQFFTPEPICTLMAMCIPNDPTTSQKVNDPTCGSGRLLLAHHTSNFNPNVINYYIAEDLDLICVKMTVFNFLLHGVKGEVIWHDSLIEPATYRYRFLVNPYLNKNGIPVPHYQVFKDGKLLVPTKKKPINLSSIAQDSKNNSTQKGKQLFLF